MSRTNIVMLLLVLAGGAFWLWDRRHMEETKKQETQAARFFPDLEKPQIAGLKIQKLTGTGTNATWTREFALDNGVWTLAGPHPQAMKNQAIGGAVKSLVELQHAEDLSTATPPLNAHEFGLDKPVFQLTLTDKAGKEQSLVLGAKTPDENGYYASKQANGSIYTINATLPELLELDPETQRETSPLVFEPSTINKLTLEPAAGPPVEVASAKPREKSKDDASDDGIEMTDLNEEWNVVKPQAGKADWEKIRTLMWAWRDTKLGRFMKPSEAADFSHPTVKLTATVDGQPKPFVIEVGRAVPGKSGLYYARRTPPTETMVLQFSDLKLLEPKLASVLDQHINKFEKDDADGVEATLNGVKVSSKRADDKWVVSEPKVTAATPNPGQDDVSSLAIGDLVDQVSKAEWSAKEAPKGAWSERGSIEVRKGSTALAKLVLGPPGPNGKGAYVRDAAGVTYLMENDPAAAWKDILARLQGTSTPTPTPAMPGFTMPGR